MEQYKGSMESLSKPSVASGSERELNEGDITERRMKQLLGRMYNDKQYLERLVEQAGRYNINNDAPFLMNKNEGKPEITEKTRPNRRIC